MGIFLFIVVGGKKVFDNLHTFWSITHSLDHLMHSFSALSLISTYSLSSPHHFRISLNFIGFIKNEFGSQLKFLNYLTTIGISHICCGAKYSIETRLFFVSIHTYVHSIEIGWNSEIIGREKYEIDKSRET